MATKLKSYTIVPDTLYVERRADQQLHNIVEAMQRPGYVLVSRQMGKTNLLLRAKRKWENTDDIYVYIDMSNINETEKECFESLIDTAIDTHEELLSPIREKIAELRRINITKSPVQAHNEELRTVLKAIKGKLVFILDEIDSLTRTSFSDNVFSQIRSVYFSRVNYPVLDKLTYVLSGVVEPTEIIKNPKISPFNIGEKILLDDFTHDEYLTFIEKAELKDFGEEVIERIYYWAEGNPRITWDICYELQSMAEKTADIVDSLVKDMYLTSFDKAPVDTIRSIVKEDRDLRDGIIQLAYDKGQALSDKIKNKLYLSGIINYDEKDVHIKNRIIKDSLSLNWLQKVEEEEKGLLNYAIELHSKGYYQESIDKFELYLKNNDFPAGNAPFYYYYMGSCLYHLKNYSQSLNYLTLETIDKAMGPYEYRHANFLAGADCLELGKIQDSLEYFNEAMTGEVKDWVFYFAKLNSLIARQRLAQSETDEMRDIEQNYVRLMELPEENSYANIKLYAAIQLAAIYRTNDPQKACSVYDKALLYAKDSARIRLLIEKFEVVDPEKKQTLLDELIYLLAQVEEVADTLGPDNNLDLDEDVFTRGLLLIYIYDYSRWNEIREKMSLLPYSYGDALYHVFLQTFTSSNHVAEEGSSRLIKDIHDNLSSDAYNISSENKTSVYKYNAFFNFTADNAKEYLASFRETEDKIDTIGLWVVHLYAWLLFKYKEYRNLIRDLDWVVERYPIELNHQDLEIRSLIEYCLMMSYSMLSDIKSAQSIGRLILSYIDDVIKVSRERVTGTLTQIKKAALSVFATSLEPYKRPKTYARNERVRVRYHQSNKTEVKKYKQVERDLKDGICVIIEE